MVNDELKPRLRVPRERAIRAGPFEVGYRMFWALVFFIISIIVLAVAVQAGALRAGVLIAIVLVVLYMVLFGMSTAAMGYRYGAHLLRNLRGANLQTSEHPATGEVLIRAWSKRRRPKPLKIIGRVEFLPHETDSGILGVALDQRYGTYSASMWGAGSSLLNASENAKMSRLKAFAALLDSMAEADNHIYRFAWHEQTLLREPQHPGEVMEAIRQTSNLTRQNPPNQRIVAARMDEMGEASVVHRTTMTVSVLGSRVRREAKSLGGSTTGYARVLEKRLEAFHALAMGLEYGYSSIGLKAARFATYNDLVLENRLVLDPVFAQRYWQEWKRPDDREHLLDEQEAWPGYVDFRTVDYCRLGETYHCGFYIHEFTRAGMPPDQIWNIIKLPVPKTVTVVFQMVPARRAQRFAEFRTSGAAGSNVDRAKANRRVTAVQSQEAEEALLHETEMATHQGQVGRARCYVDLTGRSLEEVQANAALLRHACTDARFLLEPLTGRQHLGIEAVMSIGRGLTSLTENWSLLDK